MPKKPAQRNKTKVSPRFFIPVEAVDIEYLPLKDVDNISDVGSSDDGVGLVDELGLEPPKEFEIISQTIRRVRGGREVVDVVIEVEDIPGIDKVEFRISKA